MIVGIAVPTNDEEILRALVRRRQKLTDQIRACKQRIRGFLLYPDDVQGVDLPSSSAAHVEMLFALELPLALRALLESHYKAVVAVTRRLGIILLRIVLERRPYYQLPPMESVSQKERPVRFLAVKQRR